MLSSPAKKNPYPQRKTGEDYHCTSPVVSEYLFSDCAGTGDTQMNPTGLLSYRGITSIWKNGGWLPEKILWEQHLGG